MVLLNHNYPKLDLKASVSAVGYKHYSEVNQSFENYSVTQRTHEIGIRMALGARETYVLGMVVGRGLLLSLLGLGIGLTAAFLLTPVIESFLFNVGATDPLVLAGIGILLSLVSALASYLPARRATRVDPIVALRYE